MERSRRGWRVRIRGACRRTAREAGGNIQSMKRKSRLVKNVQKQNLNLPTVVELSSYLCNSCIVSLTSPYEDDVAFRHNI